MLISTLLNPHFYRRKEFFDFFFKENVAQFLEKNKVITAVELYVYELLKSGIKSINKKAVDIYLIDLFNYESQIKPI